MQRDLPGSLKLLTVWLLLGAALFVGVQWWLRQQQQTRFELADGRIEIRRGADGHYHWPGTINGRAVEFLIDTGATGSAMSTALANDLGLTSHGSIRSHTAGGEVVGALVRADLSLRGGVDARRLPMVALPGLGAQPLLGMDVMGRLRWSQADGVLRIDGGVSGSR